ncbi:MAG TPA: hypothetical protein VHK88_09760 [Aquihabitans sp.]|nr:hypothetical protein [Aquihabitans sp.]
MAAFVLASCTPELVLTYDGTSTAPIQTAVVNADGLDRYQYLSTAGSMAVGTFPDNDSSNLRTVFWPSSVPVVADSQSCATWTRQSGPFVQQGAAFRIRRSNGRVQAITVTKNVWLGANWGFNFHTWDTARSGPPSQHFGGKEIPGLRAGDRAVAFPWHFCARVLNGAIEFKVWTNGMAEPAWGDPNWSGKGTIPAGWEAPGTTGWYIGHLAPGDTARFDDLRTWRYQAAPPPTTTTTTKPPTSTTTTIAPSTTAPTTSTTEPTTTTSSAAQASGLVATAAGSEADGAVEVRGGPAA